MPIRDANSFTFATVSLEVSNAFTNSTKGTLGTGFRKCIPIILSGRLVASAIFVKLSVEVFETKIVSSLAIASSCLKMAFLSSMFSSTASMINSQSTESVKLSDHFILLMIAFFSEVVIAQRFISRSISSDNLLFPVSRCSGSFSITSTSIPAEAMVWAIPCPIIPAPIIATEFMVSLSLAILALRISSSISNCSSFIYFLL